MEAKLVISNVVALINTATQFDLYLINLKVSNSTYNPKRFPAVIIRKKSPKCTFLVFKSGKIMVLGTQNVKQAELSARKLCKELQKLCQIRISKFNFRVTHVIGTLDLNYRINLSKLCDLGGAFKLQSFPGAFYHMKQYIKNAIIYSSGKITLLGGKSVQDLQNAMKILEIKLKQFKNEAVAKNQVQQLNEQINLKAQVDSLKGIQQKDIQKYENQVYNKKEEEDQYDPFEKSSNSKKKWKRRDENKSLKKNEKMKNSQKLFKTTSLKGPKFNQKIQKQQIYEEQSTLQMC